MVTIGGLTGTATYQKTNASTLSQLAGSSVKGGGGINIPTPVGTFGVGVEGLKGKGYKGTNYNLSYSLGKKTIITGKTLAKKPGSATAKTEYTWTRALPNKSTIEDDLWW